VFVRINGETHYLWRAVDHEGEVLEVFATKNRDRKAALKSLKRTMKRYGRPGSGIVRANSFTLPKRQNQISRPLIFLHFSGRSERFDDRSKYLEFCSDNAPLASTRPIDS
jgi:hypothetical protein